MVKASAPVRGKPKSGRLWKTPGKKTSNKIAVKSLHQSWTVRSKERAEKLSVKNFQNELKAQAADEKLQKRKRIEEQKKRKEENILKSEIVQKVTNSRKIKKMKKKQLRQIQTR